MKRFILVLFMASFLLAIEQVPRQSNAAVNEKSDTSNEAKRLEPRSSSPAVRQESRTTVQSKEKQRDQFQDKNSDGVNDRREDDFQSIKTRKSRHKDLFGRKEPAPPEKKPGEAPSREEKQPEKKK
ncbi:hypothetical protein IBX73_01390 [candidate division WOR-3 bacterium]|nr:hypothetical protein [candidate division WOR-3 bacterium]